MMPVSEGFFVEWAREGSFRDFDVSVGGWERHVDQDGAADREARSRERREFCWRQDFDGTWKYAGAGPSLEGAQVNDVLEHFTRLEWSKDWAEARDRLGDAATTADMARTDRQRRHDLGRRRRLFTGAAALAVRLTGGECIWPGCHAPASGCEIDHLHPWAAGGHTTPANGATECRRHNQQKHAEGWQVWRDRNGRWQFRRPDGTTIHGPHRDPPTAPPEADARSSPDRPGDDHDGGGLAAG